MVLFSGNSLPKENWQVIKNKNETGMGEDCKGEREGHKRKPAEI